MNHTELLKRAFHISWRYRPLWLFGFLLALCSGGGGGGGNSNFSFPADDRTIEKMLPYPGGSLPQPDPNTIIGVVIALACLVLILVPVGMIINAVSRTSLLGMVRQITQTEAITVRDGFQFGWSQRAWRLFLVQLVIGIPVAIVAIILIIVALSPLLMLLINNDAPSVVGVIFATILFVLLLILIMIVIGTIVYPVQEISYRRTVLDEQGVIASVSDSFRIIRRNLKDVIIVVLLTVGLGFAWFFVSLLVVLPAALLAAAILGGIPAAIVYLISQSWLGTAIASIPLALLALVLVSSFGAGLYHVYQSTFWTLAYLELKKPEDVDLPAAEPEDVDLPAAKPVRTDEDFAPPHLPADTPPQL